LKMRDVVRILKLSPLMKRGFSSVTRDARMAKLADALASGCGC